MMKNMVVGTLFLLVFFNLSLLTAPQADTIEIDWGDGTPKMVIDHSPNYIQSTIKTENGTEVIYYKPEWIVNGALIHYLDKNQKPRHNYKTADNYHVKIVKKDASGNVISTEEGDMQIMGTGSEPFPCNTPPHNVKPPYLNPPLIINGGIKTGLYYIPGKNIHHQFIATWDFQKAGISDPQDYEIKYVKWTFQSPTLPSPEEKTGIQVEFNDFLVPSSSNNIYAINNDPIKNKAKVRLVFMNKLAKDRTDTLSNGTSIIVYPNFYTEKTFNIPVADLFPSTTKYDDVVKEMPHFIGPGRSFINIGWPENWVATTGDSFPDSIIITVTDNNPNLDPTDLSCIFSLVPEGMPISKRIIQMDFGVPKHFEYHPHGGEVPHSIFDFYSVAVWEINSSTSYKVGSQTMSGWPLNFKGNLVIFCKPIGFGPKNPVCPTNKMFPIIDNDKPNIYVKLYDVFNGRRIHQVLANQYITDGAETLLEKNSGNTDTKVGLSQKEFNMFKIPPEKTPGSEIYKYKITNDKDWEAIIPEKKFFERTRIYAEVIVVDNIDIVEGHKINPPSHIASVDVTIENPEGQKIFTKSFTNLDKNKIEKSKGIISFVAPFPTAKGANKDKMYKLTIVATDKAPLDITGTAKFHCPPNKRTFTIYIPITDRREIRTSTSSSYR